MERPQPDALAEAALEEAVGLAFRVLKVAMLALTVLFVGSGLFQIESNEVGFVRTFGVLDSTPQEPGIHLAWPVFQDVARVDARSTRHVIETFDLARRTREQMGESVTREDQGLDPARDGYLITGDANLLHVSLAVRLKPSDPKHVVLISAVDSGEVARVLLERAAVHAAAHRQVNALIGAGKDDFLGNVRQVLRDSLATAGTGLEVEANVEFERDLTPSPQVRAAFTEVAQASQMIEALRSKAENTATETSGDGTVTAERLKSEARSEADRVVATARADAARFTALEPEWKKGPRTLEERLLAKALSDSVENLGDLFLVPEGELRVKLERDVRDLDKQLQREARDRQ